MRQIDLKRLIQLIYDSKDIQANLNLDEGCILKYDDQNTLVKVINYFLNFLIRLTDQPL